jgi:hypothetical protein
MDEYDIYLRGLAWDRAESPAAGLSRVFGVTTERATALLGALPRVVKRRVPAEQLPRYTEALDSLGASFEFRRSAIVPRAIVPVVGGTKASEPEGEVGLSLPPPFDPSERPPAPRYAETVLGRDPALDPDRFIAGLWQPQAAQPLQPAQGHERTEVAPRRGPARFVPGHERTEPTPPPVFDEDVAPAPRAAAPMPVPEPAPKVVGDSGRTVREAPPLAAPIALSQRTQPLGGELPMRPQDPPVELAPSPPAAAPDPTPAATPADRHDPPPPVWRAGPALELPPERPPRPLSERPPNDRVYNVWAPLEAKAAPAGDPLAQWASSPPPAPEPRDSARPPSMRPKSAELSGLELGIDGRPDWLLDGQGAQRADLLGRVPVARELPVDPQGSSAIGISMSPAATPDASPNAGPSSVPPAALAAAHSRAHPVRTAGVYVPPASRPMPEAPAAVRWLLRAGLGLSMFMVLAMARHCRAFDSDVEEQLAAWGEQPAATLGAAGSEGASAQLGRPKELGPPAAEWLESDLHQVSSADKDAVRGLVQRMKQAGALEVYVGNVMRSGPMQIAGEIVVALPKDKERRERVLDAYQRHLDAAFSGAAGDRPDPGGDYLRIRL